MIVVIIIVVIVVVLLGAGAADNSSSGPVAAPPNDCYVCVKLEAWWNALPWWRRSYSWAWYLINHVACVAKGC